MDYVLSILFLVTVSYFVRTISYYYRLPQILEHQRRMREIEIDRERRVMHGITTDLLLETDRKSVAKPTHTCSKFCDPREGLHDYM